MSHFNDMYDVFRNCVSGKDIKDQHAGSWTEEKTFNKPNVVVQEI